MKLLYPVVFFLSAMLIVACHKNDDLVQDTDCEKLNNGFIDRDKDLVGMEIDAILQGLPPNPDQDDALGHGDNLEKLVDRLNEMCDDYTAAIICYACIETLPLQSEIQIDLDSAGFSIERVIDIKTPDGDVMEFLRFH